MEKETSILEFQIAEGNNVVKMLSSIAKGVLGIRDVTAAAAKDGNILTKLYGDEKQGTSTLIQQEKLTKELNNKKIAIDRLTASMQKFSASGDLDNFVRAREKVNDLTVEVNGLEMALEEVAAKLSGEDMSGAGMEDKIGGYLNQASSMARSYGGESGGAFADTIDSISNMREQLTPFAEKLQGFVGTLQEGSSASGVAQTGIKGLFGSLKGGISGLAGSATEAIGALGPVGIAIGVASLAAGALSAVMAMQTKEIEKQIEARREETDKEIEYAEMVASGSTEQLESQKASLETQIEIKKAARDAELAASAAGNTLVDGIDKYRTVAEAGLNQLLGRSLEGTTIYGATADAAKAYNEELKSLEAQYDNVNRALDPVAQREREELALQNLMQAQEDHIQILNDMASAEASYMSQLEEFRESEALSTSRAQEDQFIADSRAQLEHDNEILSIKTNSKNAETEIAKELAKSLVGLEEQNAKDRASALAQFQKSMTELEKETAKSREDAVKDARETEKETLDQYRRDSAKSEKQYQKERLRRIEDAGKTMLDAELANDVNAYIAAQEASRVELARMDEDHFDEMKEADEAFELQRQQAKNQLAKQLQDIDANYNEQRQKMQEQFNEENLLREAAYRESVAIAQKEAAERIQAERDGAAKSLQEAQESWRKRRELEEEDRALAEKRRKEDVNARLAEMAESFRNETDALKKKETDVLNIIKAGGNITVQTYEERETAIRTVVTNSYTTMIAALASAINQAKTSINSGFGGGSSGGSTGSGAGYGAGWGAGTMSFSSTGKYGKSAFAAAEGMVVGPNRPTLIVAGEGDKPELILPLEKSGGIPDGMGGGNTVEFNGNITIGDGVSEVVFIREMTNLAEGLMDGFAKIRKPT